MINTHLKHVEMYLTEDKYQWKNKISRLEEKFIKRGQNFIRVLIQPQLLTALTSPSHLTASNDVTFEGISHRQNGCL